MIVLFCDYGADGPYIGQVEAAIFKVNPNARVVNLTANAPRNDPKASAYLLASYAVDFPAGSVFFCVVDPGVGSFEDPAIIVKADEKIFVGPDNGLFDIVMRRCNGGTVQQITWQPEEFSKSFHGRDLYAPVCALISMGKYPQSVALDWKDRRLFPDDLEEIIYVDHFGNCMTGCRAALLQHDNCLQLSDRKIAFASTFSDVSAGEAFWYENANGLVEVAINQGDASAILDVSVGSQIRII